MEQKNVKQVHQLWINTGLPKISLEKFIEELNKRYSPREMMCRIRSEKAAFTPSPGRGLDALSKYLVDIKSSQKNYKMIMEAAYGGELNVYYESVMEELP